MPEACSHLQRVARGVLGGVEAVADDGGVARGDRVVEDAGLELVRLPDVEACAVLPGHVRGEHVRGGVGPARLVVGPGLGDAPPLPVLDHDLDPRSLGVHDAAWKAMSDVEVA